MKKGFLISSVALNLLLVVIVLITVSAPGPKERIPGDIGIELNQIKNQTSEVAAKNMQLADKIADYEKRLVSLKTQVSAVQKQSPETEKQISSDKPGQKTTTRTVYGYSQTKFGDYQKAFKEKMAIEYDKDNKPMVETHYDQNGIIIGRQVYQYSRDYTGAKSVYKADGTLEERYSYKYDKNWNVTESVCYYTDGAIKEKWVYQYDTASGNLSGSHCYKKGGSSASSHTFIYKYNGNKTSITEYNSDNTLVSTTTEEKDDQGNLIARAFYFGDNTLCGKSVWEYTKDEKNNIVEVTEYRMEQRFGVPEKAPISLTVYEN